MTDQNTNPEFDALKGQFAQVGKEIKTLAGQVGRMGAKACREAGEAASRASKATMAQAADMADDARTKASAASVEAERFVKERPAVAVGIAAAAGVVAGLVLRRR